MSVLIGHASISENGTITGKTGDQTGSEVCTRYWYNKPWNVMLICTDKEIAKKAAQEMRYACENNAIGYDQKERTTAYESAKRNGGTFKSAAGETDCSQLVASCYIFAGLTRLSPNCYTGNLRKALLTTGKFKAYTDKEHLTSDVYAEIGAIYLSEGHHVVMSLENGSKAQAVTENEFKSSVKDFQKWLNTTYPNTIKNNCGALLKEDNDYGKKTRAAALCVWKYEMNKLEVGYTFDFKNSNFGVTCKQYGNKALVKKGSKGRFTYIAQGILRAKGYYKDVLDGKAGTNTATAIGQYQEAKRLNVDEECGADTWYALFN